MSWHDVGPPLLILICFSTIKSTDTYNVSAAVAKLLDKTRPECLTTFKDGNGNERACWYMKVPPCTPEQACHNHFIHGQRYVGTLQETVTGDACLHWDDAQTLPWNLPANVNPTSKEWDILSKFALDNQHNYCRDPEGVGMPYCYHKPADRNSKEKYHRGYCFWDCHEMNTTANAHCPNDQCKGKVPPYKGYPHPEPRFPLANPYTCVDSYKHCAYAGHEACCVHPNIYIPGDRVTVYTHNQRYAQRKATTKDGKACLFWNDKYIPPIDTTEAVEYFARTNKHNYCRDPDNTGQPWCFYRDGNDTIAVSNQTVARGMCFPTCQSDPAPKWHFFDLWSQMKHIPNESNTWKEAMEMCHAEDDTSSLPVLTTLTDAYRFIEFVEQHRSKDKNMRVCLGLLNYEDASSTAATSEATSAASTQPASSTAAVSEATSAATSKATTSAATSEATSAATSKATSAATSEATSAATSAATSEASSTAAPPPNPGRRKREARVLGWWWVVNGDIDDKYGYRRTEALGDNGNWQFPSPHAGHVAAVANFWKRDSEEYKDGEHGTWQSIETIDRMGSWTPGLPCHVMCQRPIPVQHPPTYPPSTKRQTRKPTSRMSKPTSRMSKPTSRIHTKRSTRPRPRPTPPHKRSTPEKEVTDGAGQGQGDSNTDDSHMTDVVIPLVSASLGLLGCVVWPIVLYMFYRKRDRSRDELIDPNVPGSQTGMQGGGSTTEPMGTMREPEPSSLSGQSGSGMSQVSATSADSGISGVSDVSQPTDEPSEKSSPGEESASQSQDTSAKSDASSAASESDYTRPLTPPTL